MYSAYKDLGVYVSPKGMISPMIHNAPSGTIVNSTGRMIGPVIEIGSTKIKHFSEGAKEIVSKPDGTVDTSDFRSSIIFVLIGISTFAYLYYRSTRNRRKPD